MKKFILSTIMMLGVVVLFAQSKPSFFWKEISNKDEKKTWDRELVDFSDSEILFAEFKLTYGKAVKKAYGIKSNDNYELVTYDANTLKEKARVPFELKKGDKSLQLHDVEKLAGDKVWVFSTFTNKKKKKVYLFAQTFDSARKKLNDDRKMIAERPIDKYSFWGSSFSTSFKIYHSPDKSKILIVNFKDIKKKEKVKISVAVYDSEMNKLWTKKIALPSTAKKTQLSDLGIDNDGNLFFVGSITNDTKGKKKEVNYKQKVFMYTNNGADRKIKTLKLKKDQWMSYDAVLWVTESGKLLYYNSYSWHRKSGATEFMIATIDMQSGEIEQTKKYKFPVKWVAAGKSSKGVESIKKSIAKKRFKYHKHLTFKKLVHDRKSERSTIFLEDFELIEKGGGMDAKGHVSRTYYVFKYLEIIAIQVDKDGEVIWKNSIDRSQESARDNYQSYLPIVNNGKAYILFNDSKKNIERRKAKKAVSKVNIGKPKQKKFDQVMVSIDENGKKKEKVLKPKPYTLLYPQSYYKLSDDKYMVFGKNKKTRTMGLIKF